VIGDFECWEVYEQIIPRCPECADWETELSDGTRVKLYEANIEYLREVLRNIQQAGWQPPLSSSFLTPKGANGYVEGVVANISGFGCAWKVWGIEIVYDFTSRQRQAFTYSDAPWAKRGYSPVPGLSFSLISVNEAAYAGFISGFSGQGIRAVQF
jgi:hypothetical protein